MRFHERTNTPQWMVRKTLIQKLRMASKQKKNLQPHRIIRDDMTDIDWTKMEVRYSRFMCLVIHSMEAVGANDHMLLFCCIGNCAPTEFYV